MNTCPKCGSKQLSTEYNNAFECGTIRDRNQWYHHTPTCHYFNEIQKPLNAEIRAAKARIDALENAGDKLMEVMRGDEGIPYGDWIVKACDAENAWRKAKEVKP